LRYGKGGALSLDQFTYGIIGAGKVATVLAKAISELYPLKWILARNNKAATKLLDHIDKKADIISSVHGIDQLPDVVLICVPDPQIELVSKALAENFQAELKGKRIFHCSGILDRAALKSLDAWGARTASAHPFQTFFAEDDNILENVGWGIDCTQSDTGFYRKLVNDLRGKAFFFKSGQIEKKALYHASAVAASNFLGSAIAFAADLAELAGIDPKDFIKTIVKTSSENNFDSMEKNAQAAITGPVARGDLEAVKKHIDLLEQDKSALKQYIYFALANAEAAHRHGFIGKPSYGAMTKYLLAELNGIYGKP
jgi:predicted short-subunit dehydrogenase-like oxidoreductase (DUF2520 family)